MGKEKIKNKKGTVLLTNKLGKFERLNQEELKILINQSVQGLTPVTILERRKKIVVRAEFVGCYPLTAYMNASMDTESALAFIWNTLRIAFDCERYGLRIDNLCWDPARVFVDPSGTLRMIYWPVTTLERNNGDPLIFYYSFCGILNRCSADPEIARRYSAYFYQRSYFDINAFYYLVQDILDCWRKLKHQEYMRQQQEEERRRILSYANEPQMKFSSGWLEKPGDKTKILLDQEENRVGRDGTQCVVEISGYDTVSRRHAVIYNNENQYFVMDLGSMNGTYVQGVRLKPKQRVMLKDGDTVRFGKATYIFRKVDLNQTVSIHQIQRR